MGVPPDKMAINVKAGPIGIWHFLWGLLFMQRVTLCKGKCPLLPKLSLQEEAPFQGEKSEDKEVKEGSNPIPISKVKRYK